MLLFLASFCCFAQKSFTISGRVQDASTGEKLPGVHLQLKEIARGTSTDSAGFYLLKVPPGKYQLTFSFLGYQPVVKVVDIQKDLSLDVQLKGAISELQEVEVFADGISEEEPASSGTLKLSVKEIERIPALLGEVDVVKALQFLPGVQGGNEGTAGFFVRGGSPDQNLILLDGVPVHNASHLFGFFSVFNADVIEDVELVKGGFPARYGGRLSSVLDINLRDGNLEEFHGEGTLSLIAPKLMLEGPILKGQTSFILSGRRTIYDLVAMPFLDESNRASYYFGDFNLKIRHIFGPKDELFISYFHSKDKFNYTYEDLPAYAVQNGLNWRNHTLSARWQHIFNKKLTSNFTASFNSYKFKTYSEQTDSGEVFSLDYLSLIEDIGFRYDFDYRPAPRHHLKFGLGYTYHTFRPGALQLAQEYDENRFSQEQDLSQSIYSNDIMAYAEDTWQLHKRLKINAGLHFGLYQVETATYQSLQPRISAQYAISKQWNLNTSYSKMTQFLHLLSNTGMGLPTDLWVSATAKVKPQQSEQWSLGSSRFFNQETWELTADVYYKTMENLIEYKEGSSYLALTDWQNVVETDGSGEAYGLEILLRKNKGNTTGWIGYTLARTTRTFENLNQGKSFPYRYDRRHDLSLVLNHKFNDKIDISATWVYQSGIAFTAPTARYLGLRAGLLIGPGSSSYGMNVENLSDRNAFRYPAYHRLDLGINFRKVTKRGSRVINVSIYNAYNRINPFFLQVRENEQQATVIGLFPIIPSISYTFKF